jgi:hypothetical protein
MLGCGVFNASTTSNETMLVPPSAKNVVLRSHRLGPTATCHRGCRRD